jgi:hypothetical protein
MKIVQASHAYIIYKFMNMKIKLTVINNIFVFVYLPDNGPQGPKHVVV